MTPEQIAGLVAEWTCQDCISTVEVDPHTDPPTVTVVHSHTCLVPRGPTPWHESEETT